MSLQNALELSAPVDLTLVTVYYTPEPLLPLSLTMETFSAREEQGRSMVFRYANGCAYDSFRGQGRYGGEIRERGPVAGKLTMKEASGRDSSPGAELGS